MRRRVKRRARGIDWAALEAELNAYLLRTPDEQFIAELRAAGVHIADRTGEPHPEEDLPFIGREVDWGPPVGREVW